MKASSRSLNGGLLALAMAAAGYFGTAQAFGGDPHKKEALADVAAICLAEAGRSDYTIVIASDAPLPVRFAAEELQKYLKQITAALLPIVVEPSGEAAICVGESKAVGELQRLRAELAPRGEDGYLMLSQGKRIVLLGNSPRATLYAVYHFLEKYLGCGWPAPGEDTVPRCENVRIAPFDERVGPPALAMRQIILYPYGGQWLCLLYTSPSPRDS